jgi:hypothetical protein
MRVGERETLTQLLQEVPGKRSSDRERERERERKYTNDRTSNMYAVTDPYHSERLCTVGESLGTKGLWMHTDQNLSGLDVVKRMPLLIGRTGIEHRAGRRRVRRTPRDTNVFVEREREREKRERENKRQQKMKKSKKKNTKTQDTHTTHTKTIETHQTQDTHTNKTHQTQDTHTNKTHHTYNPRSTSTASPFTRPAREITTVPILSSDPNVSLSITTTCTTSAYSLIGCSKRKEAFQVGVSVLWITSLLNTLLRLGGLLRFSGATHTTQ